MDPTEIDRYLAQGYIKRYGILWPPQQGMPHPEWMIERDCYLHKNGEDKSPEWLGEAGHLKNLISLILGHPEAVQPFEMNPNAEQIIDDYCAHKWTAVVGHASSSKTRTLAAIGVVEFIVAPEDTGCSVISTTIADGKRRIWADVSRCWYDACLYFARFFGCSSHNPEDMEKFMPGELLPSISMVRFRDPVTGRIDEARGLVLAPAKENEADTGIGRMKGFKAKRSRILLDEASDISLRIVEAVESNMEAGCDDFKCMATLNANDPCDTGGNLCEPEDGWGSVDVDNLQCWATKRGFCRRLDAEESPNVQLARAGLIEPHEKRWSGLISLKLLEDKRENLSGPQFARQYRSRWPMEGSKDSMYSLDFLRRHGALMPAKWKEILTLIGGADPAWSHDGDRFPIVRLNYGIDEHNNSVLEFHSFDYLDGEVVSDQDRRIFLAQKLRKNCEAEHNPRLKVDIRHLGVDTTGGGAFFATDIANQWGTGFHRVGFKDTPSERPCGADSTQTCKERFGTRRDEIWGIGMELVRGGQIRGLNRCPELLKQIKDVTYEEKNKKIYVEDKKSMKKRLGYSPDCFIAETLILTERGEVRIDQIQNGDMVATPFGFSPVVAIHVSPVQDLTKVSMTNGRVLTGKGSHKIYSSGQWVRMDELSIDNELESVHNRSTWNILGLFFTRVKNTGFKALVATINPTTSKRRRDFFIESSGMSDTVLFLRALKCITKMVTGRITQTATWRFCTSPLTRGITALSDWLIQNSGQKWMPVLCWPGKLQKSGMHLLKGSNGTASMGKRLGEIARQSNLSALNVGRPAVLCSEAEPSIAPLCVAPEQDIKTKQERWKSALFAMLSFLRTSIAQPKLAPLSVEQFTVEEPVEVYNLTLLEENAYYANGCLVANCADAFFIAVDVARQVLGMVPCNKVSKPKEEKKAKPEFDFSPLEKKRQGTFKFAIKRFDTAWRR